MFGMVVLRMVVLRMVGIVVSFLFFHLFHSF